MAKATKHTTPAVTKTVELEPARTEVVLTLTLQEAQMLVALTGACLSGTATTPVYDALRRENISKGQFTVEKPRGGIFVKEDDNDW